MSDESKLSLRPKDEKASLSLTKTRSVLIARGRSDAAVLLAHCDAELQFNLGRNYRDGQGVEKDLFQAAAFFRKAADQNHADAQFALGRMYEAGEGVPKDFTEAVRWYRTAAEQGHATAQYNLGWVYDHGCGLINFAIMEDLRSPLAALKRPASSSAGDLQDSVPVSTLHPKDNAEAVKWYRKAADQGHPDAQDRLGNIYEHGGCGVPRDLMEAFRWHRKAAEQGHHGAQQDLACAYHRGDGCAPQDSAEASKWFGKAAEQGGAHEYYLAGEEFAEEEPIDFAEAARWFRKAADQNHAAAQSYLGYLYERGYGVPQDSAEAIKWYRKAANQGDAVAQSCLGAMYAEGRGVLEDYIQAHKWFDLAGGSGESDGIRNRDVVARKMTPEQIAEAQQLAREWKAGTSR